MKPRILITAICNEEGILEKNNYLYNLLSLLSKKELDIYSTHWKNLNNELMISKVHHINSDKVLKDIKLNDIADIFHIRQMGPIHKDLKRLECLLDSLKKNFSGISINHPDAIAYGMNKDYLLDFQNEGFPIPKTQKSISEITLEQLEKKVDMDKKYIIKPWDGEGGNNIYKLSELTDAKLKIISQISPYIIVQEFIEEISKGEKSLIYLGKTYSHAVIKTPKKGNYLANWSKGALVESYAPSQEEINLGFEVQKLWKHPLDFYRIDIVTQNNKPKIIEIETVNPSVFIEEIGTGNFETFAEKLEKYYLNLLK